MLAHLAIGRTRRAIAAALHLSGRTVDTLLSEIKHAFGTRQRLCLGVRAVGLGYVDPSHVTAHTRPLRGPWVTPCPRQGDILLLLSDDLPVDAVAGQVGVSGSTVRGDIYRLAGDNGAVTLIQLGALAAALGWVGAAASQSTGPATRQPAS